MATDPGGRTAPFWFVGQRHSPHHRAQSAPVPHLIPPTRPQQDEDGLASPSSAYKFPPPFKKVERIIADADQDIFQTVPQRPALHRSGSLTTSSAPHLALPLPPTPAMHPSTEAPSPSGITPLVLDTSDDMVQVQEDGTYALWAASCAQYQKCPVSTCGGLTRNRTLHVVLHRLPACLPGVCDLHTVCVCVCV